MNQNKKMNVEKRLYQRVEKQLPIKLKDGDIDLVTETKNISCIGIYCVVDRYVSPMTKVKTTLLLPSRKGDGHSHVNCNSVVVRVEKQNDDLENKYNIALYFNDINETNKQKINRYIKETNRCKASISSP